MVESSQELVDAVAACFQYGAFGIIERAVTGGGEWTLGVVDGDPLPLMKITPRNEFFDFSSKYLDDQTGYTFDVQEPESVTNQIIDAGLSACGSLGTDGVARVDLLVDDAGLPWALEVNTVPGMTDHSLVPKAAVRAGITLPQLCDREVRSALRRHHLRYDASDRLEPPPIDVHRRAG
jgi:D-alanine-D-alanine ligase